APLPSFTLFFFQPTATSQLYTLSLHDALPISALSQGSTSAGAGRGLFEGGISPERTMCKTLSQTLRSLCRDSWSLYLSRVSSPLDRKSTLLNSSHVAISYAVFCLKKKKKRPVT